MQATNQALLTQVDALKAQLEAAPPGEIDVGLPAGTSASSRIATLSKRNRELTASVNAERARAKTSAKEVSEMKSKIRDLETKLTRSQGAEARAQEKLALATGRNPGAKSRDSTSSTKSVEVRGSSATPQAESDKVREYRRECQELRRDLQRATAALAKEVGADVQVARVLAGEAGWQGRADQITRLKTEIAKLKSGTADSSRRSRPPPTSELP